MIAPWNSGPSAVWPLLSPLGLSPPWIGTGCLAGCVWRLHFLSDTLDGNCEFVVPNQMSGVRCAIAVWNRGCARRNSVPGKGKEQHVLRKETLSKGADEDDALWPQSTCDRIKIRHCVVSDALRYRVVMSVVLFKSIAVFVGWDWLYWYDTKHQKQPKKK